MTELKSLPSPKRVQPYKPKTILVEPTWIVWRFPAKVPGNWPGELDLRYADGTEKRFLAINTRWVDSGIIAYRYVPLAGYYTPEPPKPLRGLK